jgi:hypothetical protein
MQSMPEKRTNTDALVILATLDSKLACPASIN